MKTLVRLVFWVETYGGPDGRRDNVLAGDLYPVEWDYRASRGARLGPVDAVGELRTGTQYRTAPHGHSVAITFIIGGRVERVLR